MVPHLDEVSSPPPLPCFLRSHRSLEAPSAMAEVEFIASPEEGEEGRARFKVMQKTEEHGGSYAWLTCPAEFRGLSNSLFLRRQVQHFVLSSQSTFAN